MGLRQLKKPLCHGCAFSGDLELMCSLGRARTSLMRVFQWSTSLSSTGPLLWAFWAGAGAAMATSEKFGWVSKKQKLP